MKKNKKQEVDQGLEEQVERVMKSFVKLQVTEEDIAGLSEENKPVEGAPFALGWPHFCALLDAREDAERFWYQEKVQNQALTLRELMKIMNENLFYKILERPAPEPQPLGPARPAPKNDRAKFDRNSAYQKLVKDITKIINRAEAKGVPIRHQRDDILDCRECGAFEDVICGEETRKTFLASGEAADKPFVVVGHEERSEYYKYAVRCVQRYQYVCGVCGLHQEASIASVHYDEDHGWQ